jgi:hypothetical protein
MCVGCVGVLKEVGERVYIDYFIILSIYFKYIEDASYPPRITPLLFVIRAGDIKPLFLSPREKYLLLFLGILLTSII